MTSEAEGEGGFKMLTVAKIVSNKAGLSLCVRLLH